MWQEDACAARSGYVFVPALERQMDQSELERYVALYRQGDYTLPFRFENSILEEAFQDSFRQIVQLFRQSRGRTEESILRNFIVRMFFWIDWYFPRLFVETKKITCFPKFACAGTVKLPEYLFLDLLYRMGCDILYLGQTCRPRLCGCPRAVPRCAPVRTVRKRCGRHRARRSGLRLPDGTVELIHQRIHGRVHLTSVNMPEGDGDGGSVGFPASGEAQHKTGGQRRQQEDSFFHGYASSLKTGCLPSRSR